MNEFEFTPHHEKEFNLDRRTEANRLFSDHFEKLNYSPIQPFPIVPKELDKSVLFTGSVTTPFKRLIMNSVMENSGFVVQPCFRAHNIESFYDDEVPKFCSAFTGLGLVSRPESYEKLCLDVISFLTEKMNVEHGNVLVKLTAKDGDINNYWLNQKSINKEIDSEPDDYYRWKYGMDGIYGRGITVAVRKNEDHNYIDVGNIIRIRKNSGEELAVESGFGTETLLSGVHGLPHPISAFPIKNMMPEVDNDQKTIKIGDATMSIVALSCAGVKPESGNLDRILRRYIKGLDFILEKNNLSWDDIFPTLINYTKSEYPDNNPLDIKNSVEKYVNLYQDFKKSLVSYVNEIFYNKSVKKNSLPGLISKFSKNKGIPSPHVDLILKKHFNEESINIIKTGSV